VDSGLMFDGLGSSGVEVFRYIYGAGSESRLSSTSYSNILGPTPLTVY